MKHARKPPITYYSDYAIEGEGTDDIAIAYTELKARKEFKTSNLHCYICADSHIIVREETHKYLEKRKEKLPELRLAAEKKKAAIQAAHSTMRTNQPTN